MYKLKTTTRTARFYSWIWNTEVTKFKTMCPYFWRYLLTIIFLPFILLGKLLAYIMPAKKQIGKGCDYIANSKVGQLTEYIFDHPKFWSAIGKILKWLFFGLAGIMILAALIALMYEWYLDPIGGLAVIGVVSILLVIVTLSVYLFSEKELGHTLAIPFILFGDMISSLYNNWCPLVSWN